ncbi:MAG: DegV family protein, partial [Oscillospiraceae bacterium]
IPKELEEQLDIKILNFAVTVGDDSYLERVDFTDKEFYDILLSSPKIPSTSQITTMQFYDEYKKLYDEGYSEVIYVSINQKGSATHDNALFARKNLFEKHKEIEENFKIHIIDSKTYTMAYGYPVMMAAKKAKNGSSSSEIVSYLKEYFDSVVVYFSPLKLDFAKKSGRISCAAAFVGELLGLKPVIRIKDGEMEIVEKVRGEKALITTLINYAKQDMIPKTEYILLKGMNEAEPILFNEQTKKAFSYEAMGTYNVGAAIAINAGPNLIGIIVKGKNRTK